MRMIIVCINSNDSTAMRAFGTRSRERFTIDALRFSYSEISSQRLNGIRGFGRLCFASIASIIALSLHFKPSTFQCKYPVHTNMLCFRSEAEDLIAHLAHATRLFPSQLHQIILGRIDKSRRTTQQHLVVFRDCWPVPYCQPVGGLSSM
jgi:hypothetical protein